MGRVTQNTVVVNNLSCCLSVFVPNCVPFGQFFGYFVRSLSVCCVCLLSFCLFDCLSVCLSINAFFIHHGLYFNADTRYNDLRALSVYLFVCYLSWCLFVNTYMFL